jgi:hypothetical protein
MVKGLGKYATSPYPSKFILSWLELGLESTATLLCHDFEESPSGCGHLLVSTRHKCAAHAKRTPRQICSAGLGPKGRGRGTKRV